mgnify:CR=1 FL=1
MGVGVRIAARAALVTSCLDRNDACPALARGQGLKTVYNGEGSCHAEIFMPKRPEYNIIVLVYGAKMSGAWAPSQPSSGEAGIGIPRIHKCFSTTTI